MDTLLHKYLGFVCLKRYLHESHVIPFRIPHTRSEIVPCIVPFLLYSFTRGSNVTFLSFPSRAVYRSYDRDSEKKASPAFRFSAWCSSCFCNKSREKKNKVYIAIDVTSKWRGRVGEVSKARREVSMRLDRVNQPLSIASFILPSPSPLLVRCVSPFFHPLFILFVPCLHCNARRISWHLHLLDSVNVAGEFSDF